MKSSIISAVAVVTAIVCIALLLVAVVALLALVPVTLFLLLIALMKRRIGGYTGDCCGALFLLCELSFYLTFTTFAL